MCHIHSTAVLVHRCRVNMAHIRQSPPDSGLPGPSKSGVERPTPAVCFERVLAMPHTIWAHQNDQTGSQILWSAVQICHCNRLVSPSRSELGILLGLVIGRFGLIKMIRLEVNSFGLRCKTIDFWSEIDQSTRVRQS